jgi:hypothetical protein
LIISSVGLAISRDSKIQTSEQKAMAAQIEAAKVAADSAKAAAEQAAKDSVDSASNGVLTDSGNALVMKTGLSNEKLILAQNLPIYAFGDSVLLAASVFLQEIFPKLVVDGDVGRQLYNSIDALKALADQGKLPKVVLLSMGTNGYIQEKDIDAAMAAIGADHQVFWLTNRVPTRRWEGPNNDLLKKAVGKYSNLTLIDWFGYSQGHDDWFYTDQVHPTQEGGAQQYANYVANQILTFEQDSVNKDKQKEDSVKQDSALKKTTTSSTKK